MLLEDFNFNLRKDRIAQVPLARRDQSRLLVLDRKLQTWQDRHFFELVKILTTGDVLVLNDTKVYPARLYMKKSDGKTVEVFFDHATSHGSHSVTFSVLSKPGLDLDQVVTLPGTKLKATCLKVQDYTRILEFNVSQLELFSILDRFAYTPLPPYIHPGDDYDEEKMRKRYQTTYAKHQGAVAAPTAGLHFTKALLGRLKKMGIQIEYLTLHVGLGTFLPVKTNDITHHKMHAEFFILTKEVADRLNQAKLNGKRIISVGTTTLRVLESCAQVMGNQTFLVPTSGSTDIFIYPPYKFKFVEGLITNFHTPKSTLLMLVAALTSLPNSALNYQTFQTSLIGRAYQHALEEQYRFFSFGDAMLII